MSDEIVEGGNEPLEPGDPPQNGGEPGDGAASPGDQEDWKRKYLEAKSAEERANRLERELRDERAARQSPAAAMQPAAGPAWDKVRAFGETGNPDDPAVDVARAAVVTAEALVQQARDLKIRDDLDDLVEDRAERKEVREHLNRNREAGRYIDVQAAHNEIKAKKQEAKIATLEEALRREQANRRDPEEKRVTTPREVPASQMKPREMSKDEFESEIAELPVHEARKRREDIMYGRIKLKK